MIDIKLPDAAWDGVQDGAEALLDKWLVAENVLVKKGQILVDTYDNQYVGLGRVWTDAY
jgi:hypothetical protein